MSRLPRELLFKAFDHLSNNNDLISCSGVCQNWQAVSYWLIYYTLSIDDRRQRLLRYLVKSAFSPLHYVREFTIDSTINNAMYQELYECLHNIKYFTLLNGGFTEEAENSFVATLKRYDWNLMSSPSRSQFKRTNNYYLVITQAKQHIHYIDVDANEWSGLNYVRLVGFNNLVSLSLIFENGKGNSSDVCIALDRLPTLMHLYVKFNSSRSHNNKYLTSSNYHQRKPTQLKTLQLINFNPLTGSDTRVLMHKVPQATISMTGYDYYWTPSPVAVKGFSASLVKEFARYLCQSKRSYLQVYYQPQQSQNSLLAYEYMRGNTVTALSN